MITQVTYRPTVRTPAYNPIIWSCLSNKISQADFKYVFDVYINDIKVNRIKQRPNPSGYGMIDVSTLVQGYIDPQSNGTPLTQGETEINWQIGQVFHDNLNLSKHVYLKVGEEYTVNGVTRIYVGGADVPGEPSYALYSGNSDISNLPVRTWSASISDHEQQWNMQKTDQVGIFGGNLLDGNKIYDHGYGLANPLKFGKNEQDLYRFDKMVLSFLNWSPKIADTQNRPIYGFKFVITDIENEEVYEYEIPLTAEYGYGQRFECDNTVTATLDPRFDIVHVLASPIDLGLALDPPLEIAPNWKIEITGHALSDEAPCLFGEQITEKQTINVIEYCPPLYERVRLSWFNTLGGRDYLNFTMFSEKTVTTEQETYTQEQMNWSGIRPVPLLNNSTVIGNLGVRGGEKPYNKQLNTSYRIMSDWLTQEEVNLLQGLTASPQVLAYIKDPNNLLSDDYAYTCMVKNSSYTVKNIRQTKLYQGTFDIEFVLGQKIQNL